jgi:hypothetical protein
VNPTAGVKKDCLAIMFENITSSKNRLRIGLIDEKLNTPSQTLTNRSYSYQPTGFFQKGHRGNSAGRDSLLNKIGPLFMNLQELEVIIRNNATHHNIAQNDDIVVVVINDGEIDIFLNFVCSCHAHKLDYILRKVFVFVGSAELVPIIESVGAIPIYHHSFFEVPRGASYTYLDGTFTDMMWYKSFSVWIMIRLGYNVLFQVVTAY